MLELDYISFLKLKLIRECAKLYFLLLCQLIIYIRLEFLLPFLEANPWRDTSKPVYVLTQNENQLCTMKTRRSRSEVERELGLLFSSGGKRRSGIGNQTKQSKSGTKFHMLVEDIREGVLVFEDENEAVKYCDLLQGGGQGCEGVAEIEASSVFDLCQKMRALAVLFRRGRTPPLPQSLQQNLRARKRSLEDQEDLFWKMGLIEFFASFPLDSVHFQSQAERVNFIRFHAFRSSILYPDQSRVSKEFHIDIHCLAI
ncbi:uncharacterized protein LOC120016382 isoform X3 [Tripterygium wilfordii]|uniref:uncharacterized protein LOC120016382 isoform X3 n=1 Tax=Tripterygium wilfordii TaxID=458696 RepID=UPI0018F84DEE|nr:uncharacterized protein LOC120016382 isoform X3 [Tripterygium wilfordii]